VYAGHAAIALALKAREPRAPIVPLVLACYGPDWAELVLGLFGGRGAMRDLTHTVPAVLIGAIVAAAVYTLAFRKPGALYVGVGWLSHWPADFLTAHKPLLTPRDTVGLDLYHLPAADFLLEGALVMICCVLYGRVFAREPRQRRWLAAMAAGLVGLQALLDFGLANSAGVT
jgi:hypothetical protein